MQRIACTALTLSLIAGVMAQDRRNTEITHTDTRFHAKSYRTLEEWQQRAVHLRKQVLSAAGLMPLPERCPLNPQIFGRIENKDYSIEKVYIQTLPGFYLAGNLYRPLGRSGRFPAVAARTATRGTDGSRTGRCFLCPSAVSTWRGRVMSCLATT